MESTWTVVYQYSPAQTTAVITPVNNPPEPIFTKKIGFALVIMALGGIAGPLIPAARLEASYWSGRAAAAVKSTATVGQAEPPHVTFAALRTPTPKPIPPLLAPDGSVITPVNHDFGIIIPKIGVNAPVIANVDPTSPATYDSALLAGVAHASTSFTPDQNGTVYLFSHSTNYDWFVKDLNAVFYLLKDLAAGDSVAVFYKGKQYDYIIRETKIVSPHDISYLVPVVGNKTLILETCWPPGTVNQRLIVLAEPTSP
jgi:LPXTG-site transpeptidase (sortase) family protein